MDFKRRLMDFEGKTEDPNTEGEDVRERMKFLEQDEEKQTSTERVDSVANLSDDVDIYDIDSEGLIDKEKISDQSDKKEKKSLGSLIDQELEIMFDGLPALTRKLKSKYRELLIVLMLSQRYLSLGNVQKMQIRIRSLMLMVSRFTKIFQQLAKLGSNPTALDEVKEQVQRIKNLLGKLDELTEIVAKKKLERGGLSTRKVIGKDSDLSEFLEKYPRLDKLLRTFAMDRLERGSLLKEIKDLVDKIKLVELPPESRKNLRIDSSIEELRSKINDLVSQSTSIDLAFYGIREHNARLPINAINDLMGDFNHVSSILDKIIAPVLYVAKEIGKEIKEVEKEVKIAEKRVENFVEKKNIK